MKKIKLTNGYFAKVSDSDFQRLSKFRWIAQVKKRNDGSIRNVYAVCFLKMHQIVLGESGVDHKDNNGLNNQRNNLRKATGSQNAINQRKTANCSSKYKGVTWHKKAKKWAGQIKINGKNNHLGLFKTEEAAARAYDAKAMLWFGEFAKTNFFRK